MNGSWCYVGHRYTSYTKVYCLVPMCTAPCARTYPECMNDPSGAGYQGKLDHTESGNKCLLWRYFVEKGMYKAEDFPDQNVDYAFNYCRNPGRINSGPWRYVQTGGHKYTQENCTIPMCENIYHGCR